MQLLSELSPFQLLGVAGSLQAQRFAPGSRLFSAGAANDGRGLYIVQEGAVRLRHLDGGAAEEEEEPNKAEEAWSLIELKVPAGTLRRWQLPTLCC